MFGAPVSGADIEYGGQISLSQVAYLEHKAMGGIASLTIGEVDISPFEEAAPTWPMRISFSNYNYPRVASAVTRHGAVAVAELQFEGAHAGGRGGPQEKPALGPVDMDMHGRRVSAMTEEQILELIRAYGTGAMAAKRAGFGMVSLHGAHGFGLQQFMSPTINTRTDKWGGSPENRCRLPVMAIDEIKRVCGQDFPVEIRISGSEIVDGYGVDEACLIAQQLDGHADIIHVSVGAFDRYNSESFARTHLSMFYPAGRNAEYAGAIKKHVKSSLVATVGGLSDPYHMEKLLADGIADIVYMGRELVCDPDMPNKVRAGKPDAIRRCLRCLTCFAEGVGHGDQVCAINPEIGLEREFYRALPEPEKQRILVIGGGIAGMQAALTAKRRGHDVLLCEKSGQLGGRILCEKDVPFKSALHRYILQQAALLEQENVEIRLNTEVTPEYAEALDVDAIIAAVGSEPVIPKIKGGERGISAVDVFANPQLATGKVVIIGAGFVGTELAIYLKEQFGTDVAVLEQSFAISDGGNSTHAMAVQDALDRNGITVHFNCAVTEITPRSVRCHDAEYPADTVVFAVGMRACQDAALAFTNSAAAFYMVGECRKAANILYATGTAHTCAKYIGG
jgi:2,4-dienoyl-CoA reductase-like NADH-dependent reductase (Old Yellow Enzyme family)/thioredoxin reductase